jgi:hypothetical protein
MINSLWNLFLAIIAKPAKLEELENAPIKHYYPIPAKIKEYSKEEIRNYANELADFIFKQI